MKKLSSLLLALALVLSLCAGALADEGGIAPEDLKIGMVCIGNEDIGYDTAHLTGLRTAAENLGIPLDNITYKYDTPETAKAYDACVDLADHGCQIVFTNSYNHEPHTIQAAGEFPEVTFVAMTGDKAATSGLDNVKNAFNHTFESRYVSGVVAGMKLKELVDNDKLTEDNYDADGNVKIGYVGAFPYAEVVSGYTAFFLGIRSIVENVHMDVRYTSSWSDEMLENEAAKTLLGSGCVIIGQHADTTGAPKAVQTAHEAGQEVYCVGYNISMLEAAPDCALTSAGNDWSVYYTYALQCMIDGEDIATDWSAGYAEGANYIFPRNEGVVAKGTEEKITEVQNAIIDGSLQVFDCSTFTVDGEHPTSAYPAYDTDGDFEPDTGEPIEDGIFYESTLRSAPYFALRIDGITELNAEG